MVFSNFQFMYIWVLW